MGPSTSKAEANDTLGNENLLHVGDHLPEPSRPQELDLPGSQGADGKVPRILIISAASQEVTRGDMKHPNTPAAGPPSDPGLDLQRTQRFLDGAKSVKSDGDSHQQKSPRHHRRYLSDHYEPVYQLEDFPSREAALRLKKTFDRIGHAWGPIIIAVRTQYGHVRMQLHTLEFKRALISLGRMFVDPKPTKVEDILALMQLVLAFACILHEGQDYGWELLATSMRPYQWFISEDSVKQFYLSVLDQLRAESLVSPNALQYGDWGTPFSQESQPLSSLLTHLNPLLAPEMGEVMRLCIRYIDCKSVSDLAAMNEVRILNVGPRF